MDVQLPTSGCNIINSATSFYNYSPDSRTRDNYVIYDGKIFLQSSTYNQYGYTYSGTCLHTGDLVYKPEYKDFIMPFVAIVAFIFILSLVYKIIIKRLLP